MLTNDLGDMGEVASTITLCRILESPSDRDGIPLMHVGLYVLPCLATQYYPVPVPLLIGLAYETLG
jgi:hypothetical protein